MRPAYFNLIPAVYRVTLLIPGVLCRFFVAYSPSEELTRLPSIPDLASSSSGWAWPTGRDQWELEEEEPLGFVFWGLL